MLDPWLNPRTPQVHRSGSSAARRRSRWRWRASAGFPLWAIIHHRGRRSGTEYATPIAVVPTRSDDVFLIGLPWGPKTNWARNVIAAGGATLTWKGGEHPATEPRLIDGEEAAALAEAAVPRCGRPDPARHRAATRVKPSTSAIAARDARVYRSPQGRPGRPITPECGVKPPRPGAATAPSQCRQEFSHAHVHPGASHSRHPRRRGPRDDRRRLWGNGGQRGAAARGIRHPHGGPRRLDLAGLHDLQQSVGLPGQQLVDGHDGLRQLAPAAAQGRRRDVDRRLQRRGDRLAVGRRSMRRPRRRFRRPRPPSTSRSRSVRTTRAPRRSPR